MKRISVIAVGLALMFAGTAVAQSLPVPLPPVPSLPSLPPVPTIPEVELPVPAVEVPALPVPALPVPALPQVPQLPAGGPASPGAAGTGTTAPRPAAAPSQGAGSSAGGAAVRGSSGAGGGSTGARTPLSGGPAARGGRTAAPGQAGRERRRVARRERRLRSTVRRFRGCLDGLAPLERRVLALRVGLGEERIHTRNRVARLLDLSTRRVGRVERSGLRKLRALGRSGACGAALTAGEGVPAPAVAAVPQLWTVPTAGLALPLGRLEVKGEQQSSSDEPEPDLELVPPPEAVVPPAGAVLPRTREGAGIDLTVFLLALFALTVILVALRNELLRSD